MAILKQKSESKLTVSFQEDRVVISNCPVHLEKILMKSLEIGESRGYTTCFVYDDNFQCEEFVREILCELGIKFQETDN